MRERPSYRWHALRGSIRRLSRDRYGMSDIGSPLAIRGYFKVTTYCLFRKDQQPNGLLWEIPILVFHFVLLSASHDGLHCHIRLEKKKSKKEEFSSHFCEYHFTTFIKIFRDCKP